MMPGLDPGIHGSCVNGKDVDGRDNEPAMAEKTSSRKSSFHFPNLKGYSDQPTSKFVVETLRG
jgi:hypothetical protein